MTTERGAEQSAPQSPPTSGERLTPDEEILLNTARGVVAGWDKAAETRDPRFGMVGLGTDHIRALVAIVERLAIAPTSGERERAELARLLCELGRAVDPRADGLRRVDVSEVVSRPSASFKGAARPLTRAEVDAILADYFASTSVAPSAPEPSERETVAHLLRLARFSDDPSMWPRLGELYPWDATPEEKREEWLRLADAFLAALATPGGTEP